MGFPAPEDFRNSDWTLVFLAFWAPVGFIFADMATLQGKMFYVAPLVLLALLAIVFLVFDRKNERERHEAQLKAAKDDARDRRADATDLRARLDRSEAMQVRMHAHLERLAAAEEMRATGGVGLDADTTLAKVQALLLAEEIYGLIAQYYEDEHLGITSEEELLSDFEMLYGYSVMKTRGELSDRGKTDALLDRFAHKQVDAASIETTAQAIQRLAEQLPESDTFPTGVAQNDGSTALARYKEYTDMILEAARVAAGIAATRTVFLPKPRERP